MPTDRLCPHSFLDNNKLTTLPSGIFDALTSLDWL